MLFSWDGSSFPSSAGVHVFVLGPYARVVGIRHLRCVSGGVVRQATMHWFVN